MSFQKRQQHFTNLLYFLPSKVDELSRMQAMPSLAVKAKGASLCLFSQLSANSVVSFYSKNFIIYLSGLSLGDTDFRKGCLQVVIDPLPPANACRPLLCKLKMEREKTGGGDPSKTNKCSGCNYNCLCIPLSKITKNKMKRAGSHSSYGPQQL